MSMKRSAPLVRSAKIQARVVFALIMREIITPAVHGMAADGVPYGGFFSNIYEFDKP